MRPSASPSGARIRARVWLTIATRTAPATSVRAIGAAPQDRQPQDVEVALVDAGVVRLALARAERDRVDRAAEHQGQPAGVGDRAHARRRRQALADRRVERRARAGVVAPGFRVEQRGRDAVAIEAGIDARAAIDGPDEQARRDQQHQREGELPGDEDPAEPRAAPARAGALRLQPIGDVAARPVQRRRQPEHQAGGERRGDGEGEDAQVGEISSVIGTDAGSGSRSSAAVAALATANPPSAPSANSASTSVRSWRISRRRPAPSAARTARSRPRERSAPTAARRR